MDGISEYEWILLYIQKNLFICLDKYFNPLQTTRNLLETTKREKRSRR